MAIVQFVLALAVLGLLYSRMIKRETPGPISKAQAVLPVVFGVLSVPVSFMLFLTVGGIPLQSGITLDDLPAILRSIIASFVAAGLPEELAKLLFMLLTIRIFRARLRNVYEYILIGAGVGFGFTLLEEFFYGSQGLMAILRLLTVAAHMVFGMIMARHLGMAALRRAEGKGGAPREYALAVAVPVAIHTLLDAFTATNRLLDSTGDAEQMFGLILGLAALAAMFVLQIRVIRRFKRNAEAYCGMRVN